MTLAKTPAAGPMTLATDSLVLRLRTQLELADVQELAAPGERSALAALLDELGAALPALSDSLSASYLSDAQVSRQLGGGGREGTRGEGDLR